MSECILDIATNGEICNIIVKFFRQFRELIENIAKKFFKENAHVHVRGKRSRPR